MSKQLRESIRIQAEAREKFNQEHGLDAAFAALELVELRAGTRRLQDCPGLSAIGLAIEQARQSEGE